MRNAISLFCFLSLVACGEESKTIVNPVDYRDSADLLYGEICVDSNVGAASFVITDRDQMITIESETYLCVPLRLGGYSVEFLDEEGWAQTPPIADDLDLMLHQRYEVNGLYAK
jgi:hypothetical protein